jgi:hypothetical protein
MNDVLCCLPVPTTTADVFAVVAATGGLLLGQVNCGCPFCAGAVALLP